jgi:hypothetical protein
MGRGRVWTSYSQKRLKYSVNEGGVRCGAGHDSACNGGAMRLHRPTEALSSTGLAGKGTERVRGLRG